uniref:Uncharacterized protein n=1 Tax=Dunaliella tertiolecta TaxID=3047 RepID=A0A7S3QLH5_DUNTE
MCMRKRIFRAQVWSVEYKCAWFAVSSCSVTCCWAADKLVQESPPGNPLPFNAKPASLALTICGCHIADALRKLKFQLLCALIKKQICCNPENGHNWVLVRHACVHKLRFVRAFGSMHAAAQ